MKASLSLVLHSKLYASGEQAIMLRLILTLPGEKPVFHRLKLHTIDARHWDQRKKRIKPSHPNAIVLNTKITTLFNSAETRLMDLQRAGLALDADVILGRSVAVAAESVTLVAHARAYVEARRLSGAPGTWEKYNGHVNQLETFFATKALVAITEQDILRFTDWLRQGGGTNQVKQSGKPRKTRAVQSPNTVHRRMKFVHGLFLDAMRKGLVRADPFVNLTFKAVRVRKPKLTRAQLDALENAPDLSERETLARDTFLLQVWAYGARIGDALSWQTNQIITRADGVYLDYTSLKTADVLSVRLPPKAAELFRQYAPKPGTAGSEYALPWMRNYTPRPDLSGQQARAHRMKALSSRTALCNHALSRVALKAGVDIHLTTHIARHTFATLADASVTDKRKISAALGHSKFSTTEIYLSDLRQSDVNDAMDSVWE